MTLWFWRFVLSLGLGVGHPCEYRRNVCLCQERGLHRGRVRRNDPPFYTHA